MCNNMDLEYKTWSNILDKKTLENIIIFSSLVIRNRILTREKLQRRGFVGPYRCSLCEHGEETSLHVLDSCNLSFKLWDHGALIFWRTARICHNLVGSLINCPKKSFLNRILNRLLEFFPNFFVWAIWYDRNSRIFRAKASHISKVWDSMATKMHETSLLGNWEKMDCESKSNERTTLIN